MAETYYAWSPIQYGVERDKDGNFLKTKTLALGESVTAAKLGVDEAGMQDLIDSGAVRPYKVPELPEGYTGSILDYLVEQQENAANLGIASSLGGSPFGPTTEDVMLSPEYKDLRNSGTAEETVSVDKP